MAFKKTTTKTYRRYAKRNTAKKIENRIIRKIGQEIKYIDQSTATGSVDNNGVVQNLSALALGDNQGQFTGCKITAKWLYLAYSVQYATVSNTTLRFMVLQDRSGSSTAPTPAQILPSVGNVFSPLQPKSAFNISRFAILYDRTEVGDASRITSCTRRYMKIPVPSIYYGSAGSNNRNGLYLLMISSATLNLPAVQWYSRLAYTDS